MNNVNLTYVSPDLPHWQFGAEN